MKVLCLMSLLVILMVGCNPVCDLAKTGTNLVADKIATRWGCDKSKLYDFMIKPVSEKICKETVQKSAISTLCPIVTGFLVDLGTAKIVEKFSCDTEKVSADLDGAAKLCDLLEK